MDFYATHQLHSPGIDPSADKIEWDSKKSKEEYTRAKSKLVDQKFNIADYRDPLAPAGQQASPMLGSWPSWTAEQEAAMDKIVEEAKATAKVLDKKREEEYKV